MASPGAHGGDRANQTYQMVSNIAASRRFRSAVTRGAFMRIELAAINLSAGSSLMSDPRLTDESVIFRGYLGCYSLNVKIPRSKQQVHESRRRVIHDKAPFFDEHRYLPKGDIANHRFALGILDDRPGFWGESARGQGIPNDCAGIEQYHPIASQPSPVGDTTSSMTAVSASSRSLARAGLLASAGGLTAERELSLCVTSMSVMSIPLPCCAPFEYFDRLDPGSAIPMVVIFHMSRCSCTKDRYNYSQDHLS